MATKKEEATSKETPNGSTISAADGLTFNHPLYLHPSETQGLTIIPHILIGSENYTMWSRAMKIALRGKHKLGFIDGTCRRDLQTDELKDQWERCNAVVLSWIINSISKELAHSIIFYQDSHQVWLDLQERFHKVTGSRIFSLHREITFLQQDSSFVSGYYTKLKELWEEQATLFPIPSCRCETSKLYADMIQQQKLLQFLLGLNDCFATSRSQILLMQPLPSVNQAFAMIAEDEAQKALANSPKRAPIEGIAMTVRGRGRGRGRGRSGPISECAHCGKRGHSKEGCWELIGYPSNYKGGRGRPGNDATANNIANGRGRGRSGPVSECAHCGKRGHSKEGC